MEIERDFLKGCDSPFEHWIVNKDGLIVDQFRRLTKVFKCSRAEFFRFFSEFKYLERRDNKEYYNKWVEIEPKFPEPEFTFSSNYLMQQFAKNIPISSLLHLGNGVAVHIAQYF